LDFIHALFAAGKYTIAGKGSKRTGLPLFQNQLIVDALGGVFRLDPQAGQIGIEGDSKLLFFKDFIE
jgi:hypothetical protein